MKTTALIMLGVAMSLAACSKPAAPPAPAPAAPAETAAPVAAPAEDATAMPPAEGSDTRTGDDKR